MTFLRHVGRLWHSIVFVEYGEEADQKRGRWGGCFCHSHLNLLRDAKLGNSQIHSQSLIQSTLPWLIIHRLCQAKVLVWNVMKCYNDAASWPPPESRGFRDGRWPLYLYHSLLHKEANTLLSSLSYSLPPPQGHTVTQPLFVVCSFQLGHNVLVFSFPSGAFCTRDL